MFATECHSYIQKIFFNCELDQLDNLLTKYSDAIEDDRITIDDSEKPRHFDCSGGFAPYLKSFVDENGKDYRDIAYGVF